MDAGAPPKPGTGAPLDRGALLAWLREDDPARLDELWLAADETRRRHVGDEVHLRGLIEISNYCVRACGYCGLRAANREIERYRMSADEILACAHTAPSFGYGTVVMQSGEDYGIRTDWMAAIVRRIKAETALAVTLSLGERPDDGSGRLARGRRRPLPAALRDLRRGALPAHPPRPAGPAVATASPSCARCSELGYEAGSGIMVGIPGQTYDSVAADIDAFRDLDLDMIGIGPYISHPATPLGDHSWAREMPAGEQIPERRADRLQGRRAHAPRLPGGQHPQHHGAGDDQPGRRPRARPAARRQHRHAQPDAARVPREVRDLPRQGLRERDRRDVPRLPAGPHRGDRPRGRQRARGTPALLTNGRWRLRS